MEVPGVFFSFLNAPLVLHRKHRVLTHTHFCSTCLIKTTTKNNNNITTLTQHFPHTQTHIHTLQHFSCAQPRKKNISHTAVSYTHDTKHIRTERISQFSHGHTQKLPSIQLPYGAWATHLNVRMKNTKKKTNTTNSLLGPPAI